MPTSIAPLSDMAPTAAGGIARLALARAAVAGIDPASVLRAAGLTPGVVRDRQARMSVRSQLLVLDRMAEALQDDLLGFHLGEHFDLRDIGLVYYVLASSPTLSEALDRTARYSAVTNEAVVVKCGRSGELCVRFSYIGVPRHADRHQMEFWATALIRACRRVTDTDLRPVRIRFAHPRSASSADIESYFGCAVEFAAGIDEIASARWASDLPLKAADPYLNEVLIGYCEQVLASRTTRPSPIRASVENAAATLLPHGKARATDVARALGKSRRSLARRLAAEGLTFTDVLSEMRQDLALRYLADPSLSISRIAWLLGFSEASAFTHAFRRWTGRTPTEAREPSGRGRCLFRQGSGGHDRL
jgi:AraC-like DNA-binding protein